MDEAWREYLELQVKLFAPAEIDLFRRFGLDASISPLLDVGCGTGAYAKYLKSQLPSLALACVDSDKNRIDTFRSSLVPSSNISTILWSVGVDDPPQEIGEFRGAIARYVVQYSEDPGKFLKDVANLLSPGSPIFIIEEDDGLYNSYPPFEALARFLEINQRWADLYGSTRQMGRRIPKIVVESGLHVRHVEVLCHSNHNVDPMQLVRYFELALRIIAVSTPSVVSESEASQLANDMKTYVRDSGGRCFFYYPQVVTVAETPR